MIVDICLSISVIALAIGYTRVVYYIKHIEHHLRYNSDTWRDWWER